MLKYEAGKTFLTLNYPRHDGWAIHKLLVEFVAVLQQPKFQKTLVLSMVFCMRKIYLRLKILNMNGFDIRWRIV